MSRELLRLESVPVFQNKVFGSRQDALSCDRGDIVLVQDAATGLVHNRAFNPALVDYDSDYQNEQAHSPAFQKHLDDVTTLVLHHLGREALLDVGCGKGTFVEHLRAIGVDARGIDPAYEGDSPYILARRFEPGLGLNAGGLILRHVLEHIRDPYTFLLSLKAANGGQGRIYVEVPCLDWILTHRAWFDFFYEHVNYFRAEDFSRLFAGDPLVGHLFGGQYLFVVADLAMLRDPAAAGIPSPPPADFPSDLMAGLERNVAVLRRDRPQAIWGAAAKGATYALQMIRRGVELQLAIDINPAKQGKFLAGSGLPVMSPADGLARLGRNPDIHVMNSNYLAEIQASGGPGPRYLAADQCPP